MSDRRKTGISGITGKMVVIRHATDTDRVKVEEYLSKHGQSDALAEAEVVIAAEEERIIGFGIMKKEQDAGCRMPLALRRQQAKRDRVIDREAPSVP